MTLKTSRLWHESPVSLATELQYLRGDPSCCGGERDSENNRRCFPLEGCAVLVLFWPGEGDSDFSGVSRSFPQKVENGDYFFISEMPNEVQK